MRVIPHPETEQLHLPGVLHALSDPVRMEIVVGAGRGSGDVLWPHRGRHLQVDADPSPQGLRDAGLTRTRCEGVQRFVSLRSDDIDSRFPGLLELVLSHAPASMARV